MLATFLFVAVLRVGIFVVCALLSDLQLRRNIWAITTASSCCTYVHWARSLTNVTVLVAVIFFISAFIRATYSTYIMLLSGWSILLASSLSVFSFPGRSQWAWAHCNARSRHRLSWLIALERFSSLLFLRVSRTDRSKHRNCLLVTLQ